jgi:hypothetical protein
MSKASIIRHEDLALCHLSGSLGERFNNKLAHTIFRKRLKLRDIS